MILEELNLEIPPKTQISFTSTEGSSFVRLLLLGVLKKPLWRGAMTRSFGHFLESGWQELLRQKQQTLKNKKTSSFGFNDLTFQRWQFLELRGQKIPKHSRTKARVRLPVKSLSNLRTLAICCPCLFGCWIGYRIRNSMNTQSTPQQ